MLLFSYVNAWAPGACAQTSNTYFALKSTLIVMVTALLMVISSQNLLSQAPPVYWTESSNHRIGYQLNTYSDTLAANQLFSITLHLETKSGIFCSGVEIDLTCSPLVQYDDGYSIHESSWLGDESEMEISSSASTESSDNTWRLSRLDHQPRSGSGRVMTVNFLVGNYPIPSNEVVQALDGGLIIIDNIDMLRVSGPIEAVKTVVYPNPFTDRVIIQSADSDWEELRIRDSSGKALISLSQVPSGEYNLESLSPGIYYLEMRKKGGNEVEIIKLLKY